MLLRTQADLSKALQGMGLSGRLNTAFIERVNLTVRQGLAALARRTWATAQQSPHLLAHLDWWRAYYHFARPHSALRVALVQPKARGGSRLAQRYRQRTPAMAAGRTNRRWSARGALSPLAKGFRLRGIEARWGAVSVNGEIGEGASSSTRMGVHSGERRPVRLPYNEKIGPNWVWRGWSIYPPSSMAAPTISNGSTPMPNESTIDRVWASGLFRQSQRSRGGGLHPAGSPQCRVGPRRVGGGHLTPSHLIC